MVGHVRDKLISNGVIQRNSGNKTLILNNNNLSSFKQTIDLKALDKYLVKNQATEDPNIGVIDSETYLSASGEYKIYCLGFKTNLDDRTVIYYINEQGLDSCNIVIQLIDELLRPKYQNITFYCHNLGRYDIVFIIKVLTEYNENNLNINKYNLNYTFRDDKILKVTISKTNDKIKRSFSLCDSYSILDSKLSHLAKTFEVDTLKGIFPYKYSF